MMGEVIFDASEDNSKDKDVADTSKESYKELVETGELGRQEARVLQAFRNMDYVATRNEVKQEELPSMEKSSISGRVRSLIEDGRLQKVGKREDVYSGRKSEILMVVK